MSFIPIVDFSKLSGSFETETDRKLVFNNLAKEFGEKLHKIGFVYIINHGIPQNMVDEMLNEAGTFFALQKPIKQKYLKSMGKSNTNYHGYVEPGQECLNIENQTYEFKEAFDVFGRNRYYPEEVPQLKRTMEDLENVCKNFTMQLFRMIGVALDLEDEDALFKLSSGLTDCNISNPSLVRAVHYPPIDENANLPKNTVRCGVHSDYGMLTILFQDPIGGLEVKNTDGNWQPATPIPGSVLVNIGETLEIISGKYFPATLHRVPIPESERQKSNSRTSFGCFTYPDEGTILSPLKKKDGSLIGDFKPFDPILRGLEIAAGTYSY